MRPSQSGTQGKQVTYRCYPDETMKITNPARTSIDGKSQAVAIAHVDRGYIAVDEVTVDGQGAYQRPEPSTLPALRRHCRIQVTERRSQIQRTRTPHRKAALFQCCSRVARDSQGSAP